MSGSTQRSLTNEDLEKASSRAISPSDFSGSCASGASSRCARKRPAAQISQPHQCRHERLHIDLEQARAARFQSARRSFRQQAPTFDKAHFRAAFHLVHVMRSNKIVFPRYSDRRASSRFGASERDQRPAVGSSKGVTDRAPVRNQSPAIAACRQIDFRSSMNLFFRSLSRSKRSIRFPIPHPERHRRRRKSGSSPEQ